MAEIRNAYRTLVRYVQRVKLPERPRDRWEGGVKVVILYGAEHYLRSH
jgi:hypothetical protein